MGNVGRVEICYVTFQFGRIIETFDLNIHSMRTLSVKTAAKLTNGSGEKGEKDWLKVTGRLRCRFLVFILCVNTCAMEVRVLWEGMQLWADGRNLEKVL